MAGTTVKPHSGGKLRRNRLESGKSCSPAERQTEKKTREEPPPFPWRSLPQIRSQSERETIGDAFGESFPSVSSRYSQFRNLSQFLVSVSNARFQLRTMMRNGPFQPICMSFGRINLPTQLKQPLLFLLRLSRGRRESSPDLYQQIFREPETSKQRDDRRRVQLRSGRCG